MASHVKSNPFRYDMLEPYGSVTCVFKLMFGTHYIIFKCLRLHQALQNYSVQIDRDLRNGVKDGSILTKVIKHIHKARVIMMHCEVLFANDDTLEILKKERQYLQAAKEDPKCLNYYFDVTFPQWVTGPALKDYQTYVTQLSRAKAAKTIEAKITALNGKQKPQQKGKAGRTKKAAAAAEIQSRKRGRPTGSTDSVKRTRRTKSEIQAVATQKPVAAATKKQPAVTVKTKKRGK